ncbi:acyl-CoA dehydrogenase family protein [Streptomyces sp. NPDC017248]|uniref:acyl-CoA dehydrogenase family protein n=1 Tax=unclassified Streptomyces TaxID=2593676 RepID=UPI0037879BF3
MDLTLDPVQIRLAEAVRAALSRTGETHAELAAIGVPELGLPDRLGGYGLGLGAEVTVDLELGRQLCPLPARRETRLALDLLPADRTAAALAARCAKGETQLVTVGVHGPPTVRLDERGRLFGDSGPLPVEEAALAVVRATGPDGSARWCTAVPTGPGVEPVDHPLLGLPGRLLRFTGAPAQPLAVDGPVPHPALAAARVRQAAVLTGIAEAALAAARTHVNTRRQFGTPLVERQSVAHRLARLTGEGDGWHLLVHEAAWRHDRGEDCRAVAAQALAAAAEHALACARLAVQLHGVRGMLAHSTAATAYRHASVEAVRLGTPRLLWQEAGAHLAAGDRAAPGLGE